MSTGTGRKLALNRERLMELSETQLDGLAGGLAGRAAQLMSHGCQSQGWECLTYRTNCPATLYCPSQHPTACGCAAA